jgi:hypothetical protein
LLESIAHIVLAAATALAWLGLGSIVLRPLGSTGDRGLDGLNWFGAGAISFSLLTFLAGWLELLYELTYIPFFVVAAVLGALAAYRLSIGAPRPALRSLPRADLGLVVVVGVYALVAVFVTCAPISSADALYYHATMPELFERAHALVEVPAVWQSYQPFLVQLLIMDGFLLWNSVQGAFAPLLLGLGAAAAVGLTAYRLAGRRVALLATAVFLAQPFALWLLSSTFVEPGGAFVVAMAAANVVRFSQTRRAQVLVLAGVFTGALAGIKYAALGAAAVVAVVVLATCVRRPRHAIAFVLPALAVALPWYVKNAILVGDPLYPLLGWPNEQTKNEAQSTFDNFGYGRSALDLLLLPARLLADAEPFNRAEYMSPLFMLFAPLSLFVARWRRAAVIVLAAVAVYVVGWFFNVQDARYLFFALPPLAVLTAVGIDWLAGAGRVGRLLAVAVPVGAFAVGLAVSAVYTSRFVPVVVGRESDEAFLTRAVSYYEATAWLNRNLPANARVALDHAFVLPVERPAMTWSVEALETDVGPAETRAFFRRYGLTHALVFTANTPRIRQLGYVDAVRIRRLVVHPITSRTLNRVGPPETMDVYRIGERFTVDDASRTTPSAHASGVNRRASSRDR